MYPSKARPSDRPDQTSLNYNVSLDAQLSISKSRCLNLGFDLGPIMNTLRHTMHSCLSCLLLGTSH